MYSLLVFLNIVAAALLFGAMMEVVIADIPLFLELSQDTFVVVHHGIDRRKHPYMPILSVIAVLTALGGLWFAHEIWHIVSVVIGISGIIGVAAISELFNVPLNRRIKRWEQEPASGDVLQMRRQWIVGHYLRTLAGGVAFLAFLLPVLIELYMK